MAELEETFHVPVVEAYGMTEASHQMTSNSVSHERPRKPGSVGHPTGVSVAIMGDGSALLPAGTEGEVVIRGANVTGGYANNPEANQKSFTNGWFHTGDRGRFDQDGDLFLTGRIKELIVRGGEKIAPREIDEVLLSYPAVDQAMAFAIPHPLLGETVGAAIVLKAGACATELQICEYAARHLADFKVPSQVVFIAETQLADIWRAILKVERAGIHDNFFEAGGDSILATQLILRILQIFGVEVSMPRLFHSPTIAQLADLIKDQPAVPAADQKLPSVSRSQDLLLTSAQRRMWFLSQVEPLPLYNRPSAYRLKGSLDVFRLQQSLGVLTQRHEILRTNYLERDGSVVGVLNEPRPVQDVARLFVNIILDRYPDGPYLLGGHCQFGVVAFEVAQQLRALGCDVPLLVMLEAFSPNLALVDTLSVELAKGLMFFDTLARSPLTEWGSRLSARARDIGNRYRDREWQRAAVESIGQSKGWDLERLLRLALRGYVPKPYPGRVAYFQARDRKWRSLYCDRRVKWQPLVGTHSEFHQIPGDHDSILAPEQLDLLAKHLQKIMLDVGMSSWVCQPTIA